MGDWKAAVNEIGRCQTMQALVDQQAQFIYDPLWQAKPVKVYFITHNHFAIFSRISFIIM